ncbi:MAG: YceI family protein [Bacteroidota bacterium]
MNFKKLFALLPILSIGFLAIAQGPLITKDSETHFFSSAPLENIEAINKQTTAALDISKGEIVVKMLIKHFDFEKKLMQEHFNENYMESEKYPSAVFKGKFTSAEPIDVNSNGKYEVDVAGEITIHGVTKPLNCKATIEVMDKKVAANTKFTVKTKDFDIKIPKLVVKNIAEEIEITTSLSFSK